MRRFAPLCLFGALFTSVIGCQSIEDRACETTVRINLAAAAEAGREDNRTENELNRNCIDSLQRLRQEIQPDEEAWFTYMRCLRGAQDMADQAKCLEPLAAIHNKAIAGAGFHGPSGP
jgi:hypothetical protein